METNIKQQLLQSIENVYDKSKNSKLEKSLFKDLDKDLNKLSKYLKINKSQAFIFAHVFTFNYSGDVCDLPDLVEHFDCNPIKLLNYNNDFDFLLEHNYFEMQMSKHRGNLEQTNKQYSVNEKIAKSIINNEDTFDLAQDKLKNATDALGKIYEYSQQRDQNEISLYMLKRHTNDIIDNHQNMPFFKRLKSISFSDFHDLSIFLYMSWKLILGDQKVFVDRTVEAIYEKPTERINLIQDIIQERNFLVQQDYVEVEKAEFLKDAKMKLTEKSIDLLKKCKVDVYISKVKKDNVIFHNKLAKKNLFYNHEERKQIDLLSSLLTPEKFKSVQKRLKDRKLPTGVASLLYGLPGTGKTESVYQIAKNTKRDIFQVDISQSKSMWFGESEKVIKKIFTDYRKFSEECKTVPILLFNEADAILSKRKDATSSNVAQTENAIQNIILQELENFDGIFFATTNLASNLDTAFERRFLFKIEFHKPNTEIMGKIWKSKLKKITKPQYEQLAKLYDFSGGQIDNIVRKSDMFEIIHGIKASFKNIIEYCDVEKITKNKRISIGFVA